MQVSLAEDLDKPDLAVGHSLGEYAALWEAGVWDLQSLYKVVKSTWILHARTLPRWVANCTQGQRICRFCSKRIQGKSFLFEH